MGMATIAMEQPVMEQAALLESFQGLQSVPQN
jgi:hypothetical protein